MDIRHRTDLVHNTVFLVIECVVLYLNENMFCLNFLAYSQYVFRISFAHYGYFFHETSPQQPLTGENVTGLGSVILYAGQNLWYF